MAVHGSGNSMMVHNSGPSMLVAHAGGGANMVGPLQDKLNKLLLNANSPAKSTGHGSLIAAGRYDNLSASLSQSVKVRCLMMQVHHPMLVPVLMLLVQVNEQFMDAICCSLAHIDYNIYWLGCCFVAGCEQARKVLMCSLSSNQLPSIALCSLSQTICTVLSMKRGF